MNESRNQFQKWWEEWFGEAPLTPWDELWYGDGYYAEDIDHMWDAWQASRAAIEINWPPHGIDASGGTYHRRDDMRKELSSAGIKVKE